MKKFLTLLACTAICCIAFAFTACELGETHNYSKEWTYDKEYHFHKCTDENCTSVADKAAHTFDKGVITQEATYTDDEITRYTCTVCGYYSEQKSGDKIAYTAVTTVDELTTALQNGETAVLMNDIELTDGAKLTLDKACVLDGNGHKITAKGTLPENYRIVDVKATNCEVTIKNVNLEVVYGEGQVVNYLRGINFDSTENLVANLNNVKLTLPDYYAINIIVNNNNLTINIDDSTIQGWSAISNHASNVTLTAYNSTFIGKNIHASPNSTSNHYSTVIVAGYILPNKEDIFEEKKLSANNRFRFEHCTITALVAEVDGTPIDTVQKLVDIRSPFNNSITLNCCSFNPAGDATKIQSAYDSAYIPDENREDKNFVVDTNKVFINGVDVTDDATLVEKYLDE